MNIIYSGVFDIIHQKDSFMPKTVTLRIDDTEYKTFKKFAEAENRTLSNFIETATLKYIQENELVDEFEMNEIISNVHLNQSLKRGLQDAAKRKGRFVWRYQIFETDEFLKRLSKFSANDKQFIETKLKNLVYDHLDLGGEPHFGNNIKKLRSYVPETWRFRIGKYRLFYSIDENEKIVFILTVEFRKDAY